MLIKPNEQEVTKMLEALVRRIVSIEWVINPIKIQEPEYQ